MILSKWNRVTTYLIPPNLIGVYRMNPDKDTLLKVVKSSSGMTISTLHRIFNVNPANEEDRRTVWKIGQGMAMLVREKWVRLDVSRGERYYTDVTGGYHE